jgi:hypothetical protein
LDTSNTKEFQEFLFQWSISAPQIIPEFNPDTISYLKLEKPTKLVPTTPYRLPKTNSIRASYLLGRPITPVTAILDRYNLPPI